MNLIKVLFFGVIVLVAALLYDVLFSLPGNVVDSISAHKRDIASAESFLNRQRRQLKEAEDSKHWKLIKPYSVKEKWEESFANSSKQIAKAKNVYEKDFVAFLDRNKSDDVKQIELLLKDNGALVTAGVQLASSVTDRLKLIKGGVVNKEQFYKASSDINKYVDSAYASYNKLVSTTKNKYPKKKEKIDQRFKKVDSLHNEMVRAFSVINREYHSKTTEYAIYATEVASLQESNRKIHQLISLHQKEFKELDSSYVKILMDMKIDFFVEVGRTSWDEWYDWPSEHNYVYQPRKVDENTYKYFEGRTGTIATSTRSSWRQQVNSQRIGALRLKTSERWPSGDTDAEYWINDLPMKYYHKYTIIQDGKVTESKEFVEVDEDLFWAHAENLGLAIATKPKGYFESETMTAAEPAGMSFMATPVVKNGVPTGSNEYGEWRQGSNGNSFFHYYGQYRLFSDILGGDRYGYDDYRSHNSRRKGFHYHGKNKKWGTNGTSTKRNKRFSNSTFMRKGGLSTIRTRGAGRSTRGRGPGGSGK